MTREDADHILALFDSFIAAEHAFKEYRDAFLASENGDQAPDADIQNQPSADDYDRYLDAVLEARQEIIYINRSDSGVSLATFIAVNLTVAVWDLVKQGQLLFVFQDGSIDMNDQFHVLPILTAWDCSVWLAGLRGDPRFSLQFIAAEIAPEPNGED